MDQFIPSSLEMIREIEVNESVISLSSMDNGNIVFGTADNILQIMDSRLDIVSTHIVEGELMDIAVMLNHVVILVRVKQEMVVKVYSERLESVKTIHAWKCSLSDTGYVAACGEHLVVGLNSTSLLYFLKKDGSVNKTEKVKGKLSSVLLLNAEQALVGVTNGGVSLVTSTSFKSSMYHLFPWPSLNEWRLENVSQDCKRSLFGSRRTSQVPIFSHDKSNKAVLLSKSKSSAGFWYAYEDHRIFTLTEQGKL